MLVSKTFEGITGEVLIKIVQVDEIIWDKLEKSKNPHTLEYFLYEENKIEIPLNDFVFDDSDFGDVTFFAAEINGAINDGAELLWVERK